MSAYYNEIEPYPAAWLGNLVDAGHIAPGQVDNRSILDVRAEDVAAATQAHFFAGIGVWSHALRQAGWPDDVPVWTGSCPCQPFSSAGKQKGISDERHLWPVWFDLIQQCQPPIIFGEQVASPAGLGWLDAVFADLEGAGYACAAADLCAAGVGAPHIRQRLFFVAIAPGILGDADGAGVRRDAGAVDRTQAAVRGAQPRQPDRPHMHDAVAASEAGLVTDAAGAGRKRWGIDEPAGERLSGPSGAGFWSAADWLDCRDGKRRPVEPGTFPLAHGAPGRVGRLRAYGNAIVAPLAAEFIRAVMELGE